MRLFEHPDFEQAVIRTAEHFRPHGLREAIIEKDYYVTEALRIIEQEAGARVIFKGGTSLSKGWNLIQRFSEDMTLQPQHFHLALDVRVRVVIPVVGHGRPVLLREGELPHGRRSWG